MRVHQRRDGLTASAAVANDHRGVRARRAVDS
jgi:hypothetical protein